MTFTTLIDTEALASLLPDPRVVVVDCRFDLADPAAGERAYAAGHIPGAVYAHLDRDLSGARTATTGRHPLPAPDVLLETLRRLGIGPASQVIVYDQDSGGFASRLWWLLKWMGHPAVAVLDGGWTQWVREGRATRTGHETRERGAFDGRPAQDHLASAAEVAAVSGKAGWLVVDARAPERYRGEVEPIDLVAGHIPGAVNRPFVHNLRDGRFLPRDELRAAFSKLMGETRPEHVVSYCGSGVTACQNLLAMEHAGLTGGKLYAGSWSEWVSDPTRPVERG
ncbi:MAG: sulfurtransferase [Vicinamibacterales bacterium]